MSNRDYATDPSPRTPVPGDVTADTIRAWRSEFHSLPLTVKLRCGPHGTGGEDAWIAEEIAGLLRGTDPGPLPEPYMSGEGWAHWRVQGGAIEITRDEDGITFETAAYWIVVDDPHGLALALLAADREASR